MKKILLLITLIICILTIQGRKATFYFNKAYLYQHSLKFEKGDYVVQGTFIVTFDTEAKTVAVSYQVPGRKPYTNFVGYHDVKYYKSAAENQDNYITSNFSFVCNGYDKQKKFYWIDFHNTILSSDRVFLLAFTSYFGLDENREPYHCLYFEKPYKVVSH